MLRFLAALMITASTTTSQAYASEESPQAADERARVALRILGADLEGSSHRCSGCHALSLIKLRSWAETSLEVYYRCLQEHLPPDSPRRLSPRARVACLRSVRGDETSPFSPKKLGIYAAGAHLRKFQEIFRSAYPEDQWEAQYANFRDAVSMPVTGSNLISEDEFEPLIEWTIDRMPSLERILGAPGNPPDHCSDHQTPAWRAHIERMQLEGWQAKNRERGLIMFACTPQSTSALDCFNQRNKRGEFIFPEAKDTAFGKDWGRPNLAAKLRILREIRPNTAFWLRTSPDGRFSATGIDSGHQEPRTSATTTRPESGFLGVIFDLETQLTEQTWRDIGVRADYDPAFFPDNSGFMFQSEDLGAGMCGQSVIENPSTTRIDFTQPGCSIADNVHLYQSLGASLDGSDYLAVAGAFEDDSGNSREARDILPRWFERAYLRVTPIIHDGQRYQSRETINLWTPWLGDHTLSRSSSTIVSRVSGVDAQGQPRQQGYRFHLIKRQLTPEGPSVTIEEAASFCHDGNKGDFSFDERYLTIHHYVDADDWQELGYRSAEDPEFQQLKSEGSSNIYVIDLLTGGKERITQMPAGQFAMFPHFRSDGWIYFMVWDRKQQRRYVVATDATLRRMP